MAFDIENFVERILPCIERHMEGRNSQTTGRRRAMLGYFTRFVIFQSSELLEMDDLLDIYVTLAVLCGRVLHADQDRKANKNAVTPDKKTLRRWASLLHEVYWRLHENNCGDWTQDDKMALQITLQSIFAWNNREHLRAYVAATTGELLKDGLLDKERSMLQDAVRGCNEEDKSR